MKDVVVNSSLKLICSYYQFNNKKIKEIKYGFEGLYITITKFIVTILISFIFNSTKETLLFLILFMPLKNFGFGIHATKSYLCWLTTIPIFCGIPIISMNINNNIIFTSIGIIAAIINIIYAPADTKKRPLKNKKQRIKYKILETIVCIIYVSIILLFNNIYTILITWALILEAILINPFIYYIFKQPYGNYKLQK